MEANLVDSRALLRELLTIQATVGSLAVAIYVWAVPQWWTGLGTALTQGTARDEEAYNSIVRASLMYLMLIVVYFVIMLALPFIVVIESQIYYHRWRPEGELVLAFGAIYMASVIALVLPAAVGQGQRRNT